MENAVAICIYNRPELTRRVLETIRNVRPARLLVIGDGPNPDRVDDAARVAACRQLLETVDWDCDVETCYARQNMGCRLRMGTGLTWAFSRAQRLIILEDDCLPNVDFFPFMNQMLDRYADDPRVMMVSGNNFLPAAMRSSLAEQASYRFSRWTHIWGWASWRRAWEKFDDRIRCWPSVRETGFLKEWTDSAVERDHWKGVFDRLHQGQIDTWDFSWMYACWINHGLTIQPCVNLVSNIGFGSDATHTVDAASPLSKMPTGRMGPLIHPAEIRRDQTADRWTWENIFLPTVSDSAGQSEPPKQNRRGLWPFRRRKPASVSFL